MEYFKILNLTKEPFSNSPEPEFFYESLQHVQCLQNLELAIRLRRGLNVVIGDVGTGKTTLCRQLINKFDEFNNIKTFLLLDPAFSTPTEFLTELFKMFGIDKITDSSATEWQLKEVIKNYIFEQGVVKDNTVVLIIDEGQKIPDICLEILREFLNYETNEYKLLQIVIFAQREFQNMLRERSNFADRINFLYELGPLNFNDMRSMIRYRIMKASKSGVTPLRFTYPAMRAIYGTTGGYPRKIVILCHQIMLTVIIQNRTKVHWSLVHACARRTMSETKIIVPWKKITVYSFFLIAILLILGLGYDTIKHMIHSGALHVLDSPIIEEKDPPHYEGTTVISQSMQPKKNMENTHVSEPQKSQSAELVDKQIIDEQENKTGEGSSIKVHVIQSTGVREADAAPAPASDVTPQAIERPVLLGQLRVEEGWIVSKMIASIYGYYQPDYLRRVKKANPHIEDLNHVEKGYIIRFPAIPIKADLRPCKYWVQVSEKGTLGEAHKFLQQCAGETPSVRLVPNWNSKDGLRFSILLRACFMKEASARRAFTSLTPVFKDAKIRSDWLNDTVFFTNLRTSKRGEHY
ncbi:MAG: AAA family ATPase [Deltaproteobacteria bacterium]|nr:AAA family ATPase [Deltaproteobacteria bacterium]